MASYYTVQQQQAHLAVAVAVQHVVMVGGGKLVHCIGHHIPDADHMPHVLQPHAMARPCSQLRPLKGVIAGVLFKHSLPCRQIGRDAFCEGAQAATASMLAVAWQAEASMQVKRQAFSGVGQTPTA